MHRLSTTLIALVGLSISTAATAHGELIINGSFEDPAADATWITDPGGSFPSPYIIPTGWQGSGQADVHRPSALAFPGGVPDGLQTAAVGNDIGPGVMFQDVAAALTAGRTYTLTAFIGSRADFSGSGMITLETVSGVVLASSGSVSPALGAFQAVVLTYTAQDGDAQLGQQLRVVLQRTDGHQAQFDAVSLTASAVPEPTALFMLVAGALPILGCAVRRRASSADVAS